MTVDNQQWQQRLLGAATPASSRLPGWHAQCEAPANFIEPALNLREGDPETAKIIVVAAPGAVGKSTLAKSLANHFRYTLVDLAKTTPLGGNFFKGGLANAFGVEALVSATKGELGVVVDALDEAQLRATPEAFVAGLLDLADIAAGDSALPTVMFGRSLAAEDAWLALEEQGHEVCILEIDFFDEARALEYLDTRLPTIAAQDARILSAYDKHAERFRAFAHDTYYKLATLGDQSERRFSGYAPVLDAICSFVLDEDDLNPQARMAEIGGETPAALVRSISEGVLVRERGKLQAQLREAYPDAGEQLNGLYAPALQKNFLAAVTLGAREPELPAIADEDVQRTFAEMVDRFLPNHPFLDSSGKGFANIVFAADLLVSQLRSDDPVPAREALKANPRINSSVLFDLYIEEISHKQNPQIPLSDVGILYEALKAQSGAKQRAALEVTGSNEGDDLEVSFDVFESPTALESLRSFGPFKTTPDAALDLRTPLTSVFIQAPIWLDLGDGSAVQIEAPTEIDVQTLNINARQLFVHSASSSSEDGLGVMIAAREADASRVQTVLNNGSMLGVAWPGSRHHPWTNFSFEPTPAPSPELEFMRRRLRSVLTAFRSHSKGSMVRYAPKIDHLRMKKDDRGAFLVECLLKDGILELYEAGKFYRLDMDRMADLLGVDYLALQKQQTSQKCMDYLESVLRRMEG